MYCRADCVLDKLPSILQTSTRQPTSLHVPASVGRPSARVRPVRERRAARSPPRSGGAPAWPTPPRGGGRRRSGRRTRSGGRPAAPGPFRRSAARAGRSAARGRGRNEGMAQCSRRRRADWVSPGVGDGKLRLPRDEETSRPSPDKGCNSFPEEKFTVLRSRDFIFKRGISSGLRAREGNSRSRRFIPLMSRLIFRDFGAIRILMRHRRSTLDWRVSFCLFHCRNSLSSLG